MAKNTGNLNAGADNPSVARVDIFDMLTDLGYPVSGDSSIVTTTGEGSKLLRTNADGGATFGGDVKRTNSSTQRDIFSYLGADKFKFGYNRQASDVLSYWFISAPTTEVFKLFNDGDLELGGSLTLDGATPVSNLSESLVINHPSENNSHVFETGASTLDYTIHHLKTSDGSENKFLIAYGPNNAATPNDIAIKNTTATGDVAFYTNVGLAGYFDPTGDLVLTGEYKAVNTGTATGTNLLMDASGFIKKDSSSRRYKENETELSIDTSRIYDIELKEYDYKETGEHSFSPIAEDMYEVFPEAVVLGYDKDEVVEEGQEPTLVPDAINISRLMYAMLEEMKKLKQEIETLKA